MTNAIVRFLKDEEGATAIEYGVIAGLMATLLLAVFGSSDATSFSGQFKAAFTRIGGLVNTGG
ncbi:MAG: Flp family type IVb pilin [Comamonadaceae bacterium]|nr:MAG: Flp family type IVb pilin [Comamonadaceae bacterium]